MRPGWTGCRLDATSPVGASGRRIGGVARQLADAVLGSLVAPRCAGCDGLLERPLDGVICEACWAAVSFISAPVCDACGSPLPAWRAISRLEERCPRCRRDRRAVDRGRSVGEYAGALRRIVHAFKYGGRRSLGPRLAALMRQRGAALLDGADFVVPVPLHPRRERARGFNQAAALAAHLGLPVKPLLARTRDTPSQTMLPAARRHRNVRDAFGLGRRCGGRASLWPISWHRADASVDLAGRRVVLVDDVSTTGATLEACARVLKAAGAAEVRALTAARAVSQRRP